MIQKFLAGIVGIAVLALSGPVLAVGDDFILTTTVGNDTNAPTTPLLGAVTPVAPTQIDINWSAATDDFTVAGYRLFRDNVQIATTTLLSYSDTGLTPSTTYQYTVDAFDTSFNFSSTSPAVSTTTLQTIVPPTPTSTPTSSLGGGTRTTPQLQTFTITAAERSALFTWDTNVPTQYVLIWGRTTAYELGSVSGGVYKQNHNTMIDALEPGTRYYYELRAINVAGRVTILSADSFVTKSSITADSLPNVQGFTARADNTDVQLTWQNTFSNPNYYVRVVRSHLFYPSTIQSGAVVYEGQGQSFVDEGALFSRSPQYYTIFVLDGTGAVSSGAVAKVFKIVTGGTDTPASTSTIPADIGDDSILRATDITIIQNGRTFRFDGELSLTAGEPYVISIPYGAVARNLKSIIVSVQNPSNQREVSAYLLKLNQAGDAYIALVPGAPVVGEAGIMVEVFDYQEETVRRISTGITFVPAPVVTPFFPDQLLWYLMYLFVALASALSFYWLLLLWRRRSKKDNS
jgi:hypothetical protein